MTRPCLTLVSAIVYKLVSPRVKEPYAHRRCACDSPNHRRVIVEISTYQPMAVLRGNYM